MTKHEFEQACQEWSAILQPKTPVERRLMRYIVFQDWRLCRAINHPEAPESERRQCDLASSIGLLVETVTALQKLREDRDRPPTPPTAVALQPIDKAPRAMHPFGPVRADEDKKPSARVLEFRREAA